jgi:hypothetical protein
MRTPLWIFVFSAKSAEVLLQVLCLCCIKVTLNDRSAENKYTQRRPRLWLPHPGKLPQKHAKLETSWLVKLAAQQRLCCTIVK